MEFTQKDINRFWSKVDKETTPDGCWNYKGSIGSHGYGQFWLNNEQMLAHRVSMVLKNGPIPEGEVAHDTCVCHTCDNKLCCNPDHLFIGSNRENVNDRDSKGRTLSGEKVNTHKLTKAQVIEIRSLPKMPQRKIAKIYGVSQPAISGIITRKTWKDLP